MAGQPMLGNHSEIKEWPGIKDAKIQDPDSLLEWHSDKVFRG